MIFSFVESINASNEISAPDELLAFNVIRPSILASVIGVLSKLRIASVNEIVISELRKTLTALLLGKNDATGGSLSLAVKEILVVAVALPA